MKLDNPQRYLSEMKKLSDNARDSYEKCIQISQQAIDKLSHRLSNPQGKGIPGLDVEPEVVLDNLTVLLEFNLRAEPIGRNSQEFDDLLWRMEVLERNVSALVRHTRYLTQVPSVPTDADFRHMLRSASWNSNFDRTYPPESYDQKRIFGSLKRWCASLSNSDTVVDLHQDSHEKFLKMISVLYYVPEQKQATPPFNEMPSFSLSYIGQLFKRSKSTVARDLKDAKGRFLKSDTR